MKVITLFCFISLITVSWFSPKTIKYTTPTTTTDTLFNKGKKLFMLNCKACHHPGMVLNSTAPALGGVTKKYDKGWLYKFTRNSYQMYLDGDPMAAKLLEENNMAIMASFPDMTDEELYAIFYFIEKTSDKANQVKR